MATKRPNRNRQGSETPGNQGSGEEKKGSKRGLITGFIILLLILYGVQIFFTVKKNQQIEEQKTTIETKNKEIKKAENRIDSLITQMRQRIDTIKSLKGDTAKLHKKIGELKEAKKQLRNQNVSLKNKLASANRDIRRFKASLADSEEQIERLKKDLEAQFQENRNLKKDLSQRNDSLREMQEKKKELESKVEVAERLETKKITVTGIKDGKEVKKDEYKNKHLEKAKIDFTFEKNEIAPKGNRSVKMRLLDPSGAPIFDVATGSGTFDFKGKEIYYTLKQDIFFKNKESTFNFVYKNSNKYKPGNYTVEIYVEDYKAGETQFKVKEGGFLFF